MSHLNSDSDAVLRMRTLSLPVLSRSDILKDKVSRKPMGEARKQHTCDFNLTTSPNNVLLFWIIQFLLNYAKMADFFVLIRDSRRKVTEKDRRQTAIRLIYSHRNLQDSLFNRKSNYLLMEKFKFMLITLIRWTTRCGSALRYNPCFKLKKKWPRDRRRMNKQRDLFFNFRIQLLVFSSFAVRQPRHSSCISR